MRARSIGLFTTLLLSSCGMLGGRGAASAGEATQEVTLAAGASDPTTLTVQGSAGGPQAASSLHAGCPGHIPSAPSVVLHSEGDVSLVLDVASRSDTTLVVRHPDGSFSCDDDSGEGNAPRVSAAFAAGDHEIWVGTYSRGAHADYVLTLAAGGAAAASGAASGDAAPGGPYHGTVTFENQTSTPVCRIEGNDGRRYLDEHVEIAPGASGTFELTDRLSQIWVIGCDGRVLFGGPNPSLTQSSSANIGELTVGTIALAEAAGAEDASRRTLIVEARDADAYLEGVIDGLLRSHSDAMNDRAFRDEAFAALIEGGRAHRWPETFVALRMTSSDWDVVRHRTSGVILRRVATGVAIARFESGLCQATPVTFVQEHDGSRFSSSTRFGDIGGNHRVPCAIAEAAASSPHWSH